LRAHAGQAELIAIDPLSVAQADVGEVEHGEIFTRRWVVELILDLVGYTPDRDLVAARAIEPACGSGAFVVPMVERLISSASAHERDLSRAWSAIHATDLLTTNASHTRTEVRGRLEAAGLRASAAQRLAAKWVRHEDFLLSPPEWNSADFVVGNPPYIRLESVPRARAAAYRRACPTMGGRADIYVGFYEQGLRALRAGGVLGFICADRWLRNAYGARLREMISAGWSVDAIVGMTGVDAFEDDVDAYPAITVIRRAAQATGPLIVMTKPTFGETDAKQLRKLVPSNRRTPVRRAHFDAARLTHWYAGSEGWPHGSPEDLAVLAALEDTLPSLEDPSTRTRIGIGIATGADKVFLTTDPDLVEPERLIPLALPRDISSGRVEWSGRSLINPWDDAGLVRLQDWPRFAEHMTAHKQLLSKRHTARTGNWYRTIDRLIPDLLSRPKLYLPDFKDRIFPVLDDGTTYPHHNLYWVTSETWDLQVLGGLLITDIANFFIEAYSVRMRGGFLRFQAQYLRRIRLPDQDAVNANAARGLARAFVERDADAATAIALPLYGLNRMPA